VNDFIFEDPGLILFRVKVVVQNGQLVLSGTGLGVDALRNNLKDDEAAFVLLTLRLTLQEIPDQARFIFMQWKGPSCKPMQKVQANQKYQEALNLLAVIIFYQLF
jgi:hypothetical protein